MVPHMFSPAHADYNFPTQNGNTSYNEIKELLYGILRRGQHTFKLNLNFGLVLQNTEDRSYRYYYPLEYDPILVTPVFIGNRADVDRLVEALVTSDLLESKIN